MTMKNVQKLRFRKPSGSPYGDWFGIRLRDVAEVEKGKQKNRSTLLDCGKFPVMNGGKDPSGYTNDAWNTSENTIIISEGGESCGYVNRVDNRFWCGAHCYKIIEPKLDYSYLFHYLKYREPEIQRLRTGTGLPNIDKKSIENFVIYAPSSRNEQKRIGQLFDTISRKIYLLTDQLGGMREYKREIIEKIFLDETSPSCSSVDHKIRFHKQDRNPYLGWKEVNFGDIAYRVCANTECSEGSNMRLIGLKDIEKKTGRIIDSQWLKKRHGKKRSFQSGDVLFGRLRPNLQKFAMPTYDGACESEIWVLRGKNISNKFLYYLIQTDKFHRHSVSSITGTKMPRANWQSLVKVKFRIPCSKEQDRICEFLLQIDRKITLLQYQLSNINTFNSGLMQRSMEP